MRDRHRRLVELLESTGPHLHRVLTRLTLREDAAEELMQELFINLAQSEAFASAANPGAYAYRAAMNLAFNWRHSHQRAQDLVERFDPLVPRTDGPLAKLVADEDLQRVLAAIDELPELQRNIVTMRYVQQDSYEMIAGVVDKTPQQVRGLCHKAICSLRRVFGQEQTMPIEEGVRHVEH